MSDRIQVKIRCLCNDNEVEWRDFKVPPHRSAVQYMKTELHLNGKFYYKDKNIDSSTSSFYTLGIRNEDANLEIRNYTDNSQSEAANNNPTDNTPVDHDCQTFPSTYSPQISVGSGSSNSELGIISQESGSAHTSASCFGSSCFSTQLPGTHLNSVEATSMPLDASSCAGSETLSTEASQHSPPIPYARLRYRSQFVKVTPPHQKKDYVFHKTGGLDSSEKIQLPGALALSEQSEKAQHSAMPHPTTTLHHTQLSESTSRPYRHSVVDVLIRELPRNQQQGSMLQNIPGLKCPTESRPRYKRRSSLGATSSTTEPPREQATSQHTPAHFPQSRYQRQRSQSIPTITHTASRLNEGASEQPKSQQGSMLPQITDPRLRRFHRRTKSWTHSTMIPAATFKLGRSKSEQTNSQQQCGVPTRLPQISESTQKLSKR